MPSSVDDGRVVGVGVGAEVGIVLVVRVELEVVPEILELVGDDGLELMVEIEELDEPEVIVEAAALSVELEAAFVD